MTFLRFLLGMPFLQPVLRPLTRLLVGLIAIPFFRLFLRGFVDSKRLDDELEKDLEQWFRGSLLLLVATRNMEGVLFGWVHDSVEGDLRWVTMGLRLLLAVGVVEAMPDQELFAIIHPGPPKLKLTRKKPKLQQIREFIWPFIRGILCQHMNRSSPVFAILAAIAPGRVGWICYFVAITQYLIIGLVTSKDKMIDVLSVFDEQVAERRKELIREFHLQENGETSLSSALQDRDEEAADNGPSSGEASTHEPPDEPSVAKES